MRTAEINRVTAETAIRLTLNLDGSGKSDINTACGFLDHMLTLFAKHGSFDLTVQWRGRHSGRRSPYCGGYRHMPWNGVCPRAWREARDPTLRQLSASDGRGVDFKRGRFFGARVALFWPTDSVRAGRNVRYRACQGILDGVCPARGADAAYPADGG